MKRLIVAASLACAALIPLAASAHVDVVIGAPAIGIGLPAPVLVAPPVVAPPVVDVAPPVAVAPVGYPYPMVRYYDTYGRPYWARDPRWHGDWHDHYWHDGYGWHHR